MRRYNQLFFTFCLLMTTGILWTYVIFAKHFQSGWQYKQEAQALQDQLAESEMTVALLRHQMRDLEQTVAGVLPEHQKQANNAKYKDLMKSLRAPASIPTLDLSSVVLEKGKKYFSQGKYEPAVKEFEKITSQYPASAYQIQARFFLAESLFLRREFKKAVDVIDDMVLQFPDHDLTGFILLRLGQISEHNNQIEEAQEIYSTVFHHFDNKALKDQARILIKNLEIE